MRTAIITQLETIPALEAVYQPDIAAIGCDTPYAVVKMTGEDPVFDNRKGTIWGFDVLIYADPDSYVALDTLVASVKLALHDVLLTSAADGDKFTPVYTNTLADYYDPDLKLFMKSVSFIYGLSRF